MTSDLFWRRRYGLDTLRLKLELLAARGDPREWLSRPVRRVGTWAPVTLVDGVIDGHVN